MAQYASISKTFNPMCIDRKIGDKQGSRLIGKMSAILMDMLAEEVEESSH